ncbi:MAG: hypothetical protein HC915_15870 [Anaerolineae bacterium]|nr:hypothetical protein [Anaerolineae bacterium]
MEPLFLALNNAYILFSLILGAYAVMLAARGVPLSGNFWGALWTNTGLATAIFALALLMTLTGLRPYGIPPSEARQIRWVYYLYGIYFIISLPGLFTLLRGNDTGRAGIWFGSVALFNAAANYRAAYGLVDAWE